MNTLIKVKRGQIYLLENKSVPSVFAKVFCVFRE
jgi:hypothetical protein